MSRVRGTFNRSTWSLVDNPAYAGREPKELQAACHDGSPFITIRCDCSYELHLHESQIAGIPDEAELVTRCHRCRKSLVFEPGWFQTAFRRLRAEGWLAA